MKKEKKIGLEQKIWDYVNNHTYLIYLIIVTIFSLVIRYYLLKYKSSDYGIFLRPWFDELKLYGGLAGLSRNIGNYTPIYMTSLAVLTYFPVNSLISIKVFSIIFDYIGGLFLYKIVLEIFKDKENKNKIAIIGYTLYILLPTVFLNSAYWAQCDGIYTAFVLISLYYLIKKDFLKGIIFWSIAFAFKFQAIFIFPLYVLMYFSDRKIKFKYFLTVPLTIFILSIPKICFSHNIFEGFNVYLSQSTTYSNYLTLNFPNFYSMFFVDPENSTLIETPFKEMGTIGIIITLTIFMTIALFVIKKKIKFNSTSIIEFGLWSILICLFFLPQMHERYLFMGDVIGIIYFILNRKKYYIPLAIELISLGGYTRFLYYNSINGYIVYSWLFFIIIIIYSKDIYLKYFKHEV